MPNTNRNPDNRTAPRQSALPLRMLWRASRHAPMTSAQSSVRTITNRILWLSDCSAGFIRSARVQGLISAKYTSFPRQDAASTRNGLGSPGYVPVQAALWSKLDGGVQRGALG